MYMNQRCHVKWANELSESFTVANGVKQGAAAVISPFLFSIYIDNLLNELKQLGLECHVGPTFAGAFGYAERHHIIFNPTKSNFFMLQCRSEFIRPDLLK